MPQDQLYATPPLSHRSDISTAAKRRRLNISQQSSNGSISIDITSIYRIGATAPLPALPLHFKFPPKTHPKNVIWNTIHGRVLDILMKLEITGTGLEGQDTYWELLYLHDHGRSPQESDLTVDIQAGYHQNWAQAVNEIFELLCRHGLQDVRIEIRDRRERQHYFSLTNTTPQLCADWKYLEIEVLKILGIGKEWESLQFIRQGREEESSVPTIVIGITRSAQRDWQISVYGSIRDILEAYPGYELAFVRANGILAPEYPTYSPVRAADFGGKVPVGHSIGHKNSCGTLGGFLKLQRSDGNEQWFGLTSHHVVKNSITTLAQAKYGYAAETRHQPIIDSPASVDQRLCLDNISERVSFHRNQLEGKPLDPQDPLSPREPGLLQELKTCGDTIPRSLEMRLAEHQRPLGFFEKDLEKVQSIDLTFGTIFASSGSEGMRQTTRRLFEKNTGTYQLAKDAMDWALILPTHARLGDNSMPPKDEFTPPMYFMPQTSQIENAADLLYYPGLHSGLRAGQDVFKKGRNGSSRGTVQEFKAWLNDASGELLSSDCVMGDRGCGFCVEQDSGSMVLDAFGNLRALLFAGNYSIGMGYVVSIGHVYEDIFEKTNLKVVSPELSEDYRPSNGYHSRRFA